MKTFPRHPFVSLAALLLPCAALSQTSPDFTRVEPVPGEPAFRLAWPQATGPQALRYSADLLGPLTCWRPWLATPELAGGEWSLLVSNAAARRFFHLESTPPVPPALAWSVSPATSLRFDESLTLQVQATDPDCDIFTLMLTITNPTGTTTLPLPATLDGLTGVRTVTVPARALVLGANTLTLRALDTLGTEGNQLSLTVNLLAYTVAGAAPVLNAVSPSFQSVRRPSGPDDKVFAGQNLVWSDTNGDVARLSITRTSPANVIERREIEAVDAGMTGNSGTARLIAATFTAADGLGPWTVTWKLTDRGGRTSATRSQQFQLGATGTLAGPQITAVTRLTTTGGVTRWRLDGSGFNPVPDKNDVTVNAGALTVVSATATALEVEAPALMTAAWVRVKTSGGVVFSPAPLSPPPFVELVAPPEELRAGESVELALRHNLPEAATVTWMVNGVAGGSAADGTVVAGEFRAPAQVAEPRTVTLRAEVAHATGNVAAESVVTLQPVSPLPGSGLLLPATGGRIATGNAGALLDIPPGALTSPRTISLTPLFPHQLPPDNAANGLVLAGAVCGPPGTVFTQPVALTLPLAVRQSPGTVLRAAYFDSATGSVLEEAGGAVVNAAGTHATAMVSHFSGIMFGGVLPPGSLLEDPPVIVEFAAGGALEENLSVPVRLTMLHASNDLRAWVLAADGSPQTLVEAQQFTVTSSGAGVVLHIGKDDTLAAGQTRSYRLMVGDNDRPPARYDFTVQGLNSLLIQAEQISDRTGLPAQRFSDITVERGGVVIVRNGILRWESTGPVRIEGEISARGQRGDEGGFPSGGNFQPGGTGHGGSGRDDFGCFEIIGITFDDDPDDCSEPENIGANGVTGALGGRPGHNSSEFGEAGMIADIAEELRGPEDAWGRAGVAFRGFLLNGQLCESFGDQTLCEIDTFPFEDLEEVWSALGIHRLTGLPAMPALQLPGQSFGGEGGGGGGGGRYAYLSMGVVVNGAGGGGGGMGGAGVEIFSAQTVAVPGTIVTQGGDGGNGGRGPLNYERLLNTDHILGPETIKVHFCGGGGGGGGGGAVWLGGMAGVQATRGSGRDRDETGLPRPGDVFNAGGFSGLGGLVAEHFFLRSRLIAMTPQPRHGGDGRFEALTGPPVTGVRVGGTLEIVVPSRQRLPALRSRHSGSGVAQTGQFFEGKARLILPEGFNTVWLETAGDGEPPALLKATVLVLGGVDTDTDGLSDSDEAILGTDPENADSDDDGLDDGYEYLAYTDPLDADSDDDGLVDGAEETAGTDPNAADSDADGTPDGTEVILGSDPADPGAVPAHIPPGTLVAAGGSSIILFNATDGRNHAIIPGPDGSTRFGLAFDEIGTLYATEDTQRLIEYDLLTGTKRTVGPFGLAGATLLRCQTLAYNPADGSLYGVEAGPLPDLAPTGQLLHINAANGSATRVGTPLPFAMRALAFTREGRLFVSGLDAAGPDRLYELAVTAASVAVVSNIGSTSVVPVSGLAVSRGDVLYGTQPLAGSAALLALNRATALTTPATTVPHSITDLTIMPLAAPALGAPVATLPGLAGSMDQQTVVEDLDGDGDKDVAVIADFFPQVVAIRTGDNTGAFTETARFPLPGLMTGDGESIAAADLNFDGRRDLLVDNPASGFPGPRRISLLRGNAGAPGGFAAPVDVPVDELGGRISIASLNPMLDNFPDFVCANTAASNATAVCMGDGTGGFAAPVGMGGSSFFTNGIPADMNGDTFPDLIVPGASGSNPTITIRLNNGVGGFTPGTPLNTTPNLAVLNDMETGDVDGDGLRDVILFGRVPNVSTGYTDGCSVLLQSADGTFTAGPVVRLPGSDAQSFAAGDLTGDGRTDIIMVSTVYETSTTTTMHLFAGRPGGRIRELPSITLQDSAADVDFADLNGDGRVDVLVTQSGTGATAGLRAYLAGSPF